MELFRITASKYAHDLSGTGAKLAGGRWNRRGTPVLYTSASRSLAVLEFLVHVQPRRVPDALSLLRLELPDSTQPEEIDVGRLPPDWETGPPPRSLAAIGTEWAESGRSLLLRIPSVIVEQEHNVLINPAHPDFGSVNVAASEPFHLDARLLARPRS